MEKTSAIKKLTVLLIMLLATEKVDESMSLIPLRRNSITVLIIFCQSISIVSKSLSTWISSGFAANKTSSSLITFPQKTGISSVSTLIVATSWGMTVTATSVITRMTTRKESAILNPLLPFFR